ncbi:MAG: 3'-5' exonuclease, partial [Acidobacteriota bacterium]
AATAALISWMLRSSGWTVDDPERPGREIPLEPRHICVLFRRTVSWGRDVVAPYLEAFESRGVPHLLTGGRGEHRREEVEMLRLALAAIEWPDDPDSVRATLGGDLFGFGEEALRRFEERFGNLDPLRILENSEDAEEKAGEDDELREIARALAELAAWHRQRNRLPIAETLNRMLEHCRAHAALALRPAGQQALANVLRVIDRARAFERREGLSFRGFVRRLEEAAAGRTGGSQAFEEGAEGVRVMTVHGAKGLEFPVVVLADLTCRLTGGEPSLHLDAERRLCARRLLGWAPHELLEERDLEIGRDRAEAVRLAYVAATRARDLLVVPGLATRPWKDAWTQPLDDAVYPQRPTDSRPADGCPPFSASTLLRDPRGYVQGPPIRPGEHRPRAVEHRVVWWDPHQLDLRPRAALGVRFTGLLAPDDAEAFEEGLDAYIDWREAREEAVRRGRAPSLETVTATEFARWPPNPPEVRIERAAGGPADGPARPGGSRFGSLVHAVLSRSAPEAAAARPAPESLARLHGRRLLATPEEIEHAARAASAALEHPALEGLLEADRVLREAPFVIPLDSLKLRGAGGGDLLLEGVIDLAWLSDGAWTVVDFKTDAALAAPDAPDAASEAYRRQIAWYVCALGQLTGQPAEGILLVV